MAVVLCCHTGQLCQTSYDDHIFVLLPAEPTLGRLALSCY